MKRLVDELCEALDLIGRRDPSVQYNAVAMGMYLLGGDGKYPTVGKLPPPPPGAEDKRKIGQVRGHHTLEQFCDRLRVVVDDYSLYEEFVVVSYVRAIDDRFEMVVEGYAKGKANIREMVEDFQALADDPEKLAAYNANARHIGKPMTTAEAMGMADFTRVQSQASLSELRERRQALDLWREITGPIIDPTHLKEYLDSRVIGGRLDLDAD
jgi:hypothetical protein